VEKVEVHQAVMGKPMIILSLPLYQAQEVIIPMGEESLFWMYLEQLTYKEKSRPSMLSFVYKYL
jgi:hypothetical protein